MYGGLFSSAVTLLMLSRLGPPPTPCDQLPQEEVRTQQSVEAEEEAKVERLRRLCWWRTVSEGGTGTDMPERLGVM